MTYDFSASIASVKSTSVSTNTRPRIMAARIGPAAPGFRAMPSQAAEAIRPCPRPQPNAATPMPIATANAVRALLLPAAASVPCANAPGATNKTPASAVTTYITFFMYCLLMNCRQEVVPGHRAAGLTLEQQIAGELPPANLNELNQCSSAVAKPR